MSVFLMLILALVLDFFLGEPEELWDRAPHPATLMGRLVNALDETLNRGGMRRIKGLLAVIVLVVVAGVIGLVLWWVPDFGVLEVIVAAILLAHRSLIDHVREVADALRESVVQGRNAVSMIVGRDTGAMDGSAVSRAAIESAAENFSDGVVAPAFWFLIAGLPGILIYKIVNTADSMIGHQNVEYGEFGFFAAKLDDLLNWIPARITAGLICLASLNREAFDVALEDSAMHRSPNAGWPEAAMAGVLNVALSGPRSYDGQVTEDPFVNSRGKKELGVDDIERAIGVLNRTWVVMVAILALPLVIIWVF